MSFVLSVAGDNLCPCRPVTLVISGYLAINPGREPRYNRGSPIGVKSALTTFSDPPYSFRPEIWFQTCYHDRLSLESLVNSTQA